MKTIWKFGLTVLFLLLAVLSTTSAVTASTEMIAIDPPDPNTPNIIGLSTDTIDRMISRIESQKSSVASLSRGQDTVSELQRIKENFPDVTLEDVQFIDEVLALQTSELRKELYPEESDLGGFFTYKWRDSGTFPRLKISLSMLYK